MNNIIETLHLERRFGKTEAVHDLTLNVPTGSVFALLGPNGAGKSTTIKMLMNLVPPTSGTARVLGVDSKKLSPTEFARIGYVAETIELPEWMTVRQFLDYCRPFYPKWDSELEKTLLGKFELPPERKIKHLSRGMRMKTLLLSTLAYRPALLVLDEPFSGLDPVMRDDFIRGVLEVSSLGDWTVFVSSHDIEEVERLADWVGIIDQGKLHLSETLESLQRRFRRVEITRTSPAPTPKVPPTWTDYSEAGLLVRLVETKYAHGESEKSYGDIFPGGSISVQTMPLRDIYIAIARTTRSTTVQK